MLLVPGLSSYGFTYDNWGADPSLTPGTSVVPGASDAEGSWTQVASSANIAQDCYWLEIIVTDGNTSAQIKSHLLDIGVDPAGGTSYSAVISNMVCGGASAINAAGGGSRFFFPFFIKAGSSVAARVQGSNATAGTVRVTTKFWGQPSRPESVPVGQFSETIGTITGSQGVTFTPGNAADGAWTSLGTTANALWWWNLGVQCADSTITAHQLYIDLAVGDASNKRVINRTQIGTTSTESVGQPIAGNLSWVNCYCPVPAGGELFVRGRSSAAPNADYNAVAIGIGGSGVGG